MIAESLWCHRTHYENAMDAFQIFKATGKVAKQVKHWVMDSHPAWYIHFSVAKCY